jgi:cysteine desulfurase/selenocysteine lyase
MFPRGDFPLLHDDTVVYLDSAATTLKPRQVAETVTSYLTGASGTVHRAIYRLAREATEQYEGVRLVVQEFLGARFPEEIVFTRGATDSINLVALSWGRRFIGAGDEILISEMEHHSNLVPWQMLAQEKGAVLRWIPVVEDGTLDLEAYGELLSVRTKLVAVTHLSNVLGTINPIAEMCRQAHAVGAVVCVDGAQSAAHLSIDVVELGADFFVFSGHKVFGPTGVGVLYGRKELLEVMPPVQGGGDMIESVTWEKATFQPPPLRFEAGTPPIAEVLGLGAALKYMRSFRTDDLQAYEKQLLAHALGQLERLPGIRGLGAAKERGPIATFTLEGHHPLDVGTLLDLGGIAVRTGHLCAQPLLRKFGCTAAIRLSFAPYTTIEEIDRCVGAIHQATHSGSIGSVAHRIGK